MTDKTRSSRIPMVDSGNLSPAQQEVYDQIVGGKRARLAALCMSPCMCLNLPNAGVLSENKCVSRGNCPS